MHGSELSNGLGPRRTRLQYSGKGPSGAYDPRKKRGPSLYVADKALDYIKIGLGKVERIYITIPPLHSLPVVTSIPISQNVFR
jgi:hypothetical protein